ncbi:MAG: ISL3 family transposase [Lachnospiraceae bacterium]|nr:ISL3 family transposase [Lachnospiraceae bacterium]
MAEMMIPVRDRESVLRSTENITIQELLFGNMLEVDPEKNLSVDYDGRRVHVFLRSTSESGICPCCGTCAHKVHCTNYRHPQWMPIGGMTTYAHIALKRFKCENESCPQQTFVEELENARKYQQRSDLVNTVLFAVSVFCSDIAAAMICRDMGIMVSHDSANRIIEHCFVEDDPDIEFIGVDDVCLRKGQTYHTAIYDGNDHHLLALLDGRDGKALKEWLREHPKIKIVARDRASAYAAAIAEVLPQAMQVADRFHILQNLLDYLNDIFKAEMPQKIFIRDGVVLDQEPDKVKTLSVPLDSPELNELHYDNTPPVDKNGNEIHYCNKNRNENSEKYRTYARNRAIKYERVQALRREWASADHKNMKQFAKQHSVSVSALKKYLSMSEEEAALLLEIKEYKKHRTDMDDYMNIVFKMLSDGQRPELIYSYILHIGYKGSSCSLENHIKFIALNNFSIKLGKDFHTKEVYPDDTVVIRRFDVLKYISMKNKDKMKDSDVVRYFDQIREKYPAVELCSEIWTTFYLILMGDDPDKIDDFLEKYEGSAISPFVNGIKKDIAAVKNAISSLVSSGFVEGGNCRYKSTKRLMFGRSGINHLFKKTYAISIIMRQGKSASGLIDPWLNE